MGFNAVAHETARTILDLTLDRIQELSVLNNEEDSKNETRKITQNLVGLMSDRASNMKSAGRLLDEHRAVQLPDTTVQLEFLHCNTHFLLALSSAAEKALVHVTKECGLEGNLGREKLTVFNSFSSRSDGSSVCRYVCLF